MLRPKTKTNKTFSPLYLNKPPVFRWNILLGCYTELRYNCLFWGKQRALMYIYTTIFINFVFSVGNMLYTDRCS